MYEIRIAKKEDRPGIVNFIDTHWRKNHIFVQNRALLDWQHLDRRESRYNFVIGVEKSTGELHGILGFIPLNQFDSELGIDRLCWLAIWKTCDAARGRKLGRRLLSHLETEIHPKILSTVAASEMTLSMYQEKGFQTGRLDQYFVVNFKKTEFKLIQFDESQLNKEIAGSADSAKKLNLMTETDIRNFGSRFPTLQQYVPVKSADYVINRYLQHPVYSYRIYGILENDVPLGFIVIRVCGHGARNALRIVDFIGPSSALCGLAMEWSSLLQHFDAEYIDFCVAGLAEKDLFSAGFTKRKAGDGAIVPNYFEPFSKENIDIDYMISVPSGEPFRIVKGDSDQDRPNIDR